MRLKNSFAFTLLSILLVSAGAQAAITWDVSINDPGSMYQAYYAGIQSNLSAALSDWSTHLVSSTTSSIQIEIDFSTSVTRSTAFSAASAFVDTVNGVNVYEQGVAYEIRTGLDPNGAAPDLYLKFQPSYLSGELWFDPSPQTRTAPVPSNKTDAYSVLLHELAHAIGFNGWRDGTNGALPGSPPYESTFDKWEVFDGSNLFFTGPMAEDVYHGPVPITYANNWHLGNSSPRPGADLIPDLMNGVVFSRAARYDISALDLAILSDAGVVISRLGDVNRDEHVNVADIAALETALADLIAYQATHGSITNAQLVSIGDLNGDRLVTSADLQGLIVLLANGSGGSLNTVPEPSAFLLLALSMLGFALPIQSVPLAKNRRLSDNRPEHAKQRRAGHLGRS